MLEKNLLYWLWKQESLYGNHFQAVGNRKTAVSIVLHFSWMILLRNTFDSLPQTHQQCENMLTVQPELKVTSIKEMVRVGWCLLSICAKTDYLWFQETVIFFTWIKQWCFSVMSITWNLKSVIHVKASANL